MSLFESELDDTRKLKSKEFSFTQEDFVAWYKLYARRHRTTGCRITHMMGVPALLLSIPAFIKRPPLGLSLVALGYTLQVLGHYVFEKNHPVLLETKDVRVIPVAIVFVARDWQRFLKGKFTNREITDSLFQPTQTRS